MTRVPARLFAPDRAEIVDLDGWLEHVPEADETTARAWLEGLPEELADVLGGLAEFDSVNARPGHPTGDFRHGVFACLRSGADTTLVLSVLDDDADPERVERARAALAEEAAARGVGRSAVAVHRPGTPARLA